MGRFPGGGCGNTLQYSCLEDPMVRGALRAIVDGVTKSWTQLSDFHIHIWTSLVAQTVKRLSIMWETWVRSLGPGEGNGNPLQYSCLENPTDGGAWCPLGRKESVTTEQLHFHFDFFDRLVSIFSCFTGLFLILLG